MASYRALVRIAGVASLLAAADSLLVGAGIDTIGATTLAIGGATATAVSVSRTGVTTTVLGALAVTQALTAVGSGTGLAVTNDATVGGTLGVTGISTLTGLLNANGNIDRSTGAAWSLFATTGTSGTIGRTGQTVTFPGNVTVTGTLTASVPFVVTGLTTTALASGDIGTMSSTSTVTKAKSDGTANQARCYGVNAGVAGSMTIAGRVTVNFTTAGGAPAVGDPFYLAAHADDTNTGDGKATATEPTTGYSAPLGVVEDITLYAGSKTCVVLLQPKSLTLMT